MTMTLTISWRRPSRLTSSITTSSPPEHWTEKTVSKMMMPRCGVPDIINGTSSMRSAKKRHHHGMIHTTAHYSFFRGNPKWPSSKYHLTYGFLPGTPSNAMGSVARAFATWEGNTHFTFSQAQSYENADLKISFHKGAYDLETVALHEIGHLLGLGHSSVEGAIMFPTIRPGVTQSLHGDDVQGIKALYNV
ncbi:hypothetical protein M0R45_030303 [Rubus argutus]|uniref:Peptidase metallopeptidase domain-containing protein n=1 Tax=Rubus argutus TaxID=59490 RepID=A0AAW1WBG7_RUBAR